MRAGLLKDIVTIMRPTVTRNAVGEQVTNYTAVAAIHARIIVNRKQRATDNGEVWMPTTKTIEVRIYQDIKSTDLIEIKGTMYRIVDIETDRPLQCLRLTLIENNE